MFLQNLSKIKQGNNRLNLIFSLKIKVKMMKIHLYNKILMRLVINKCLSLIINIHLNKISSKNKVNNIKIKKYNRMRFNHN